MKKQATETRVRGSAGLLCVSLLAAITMAGPDSSADAAAELRGEFIPHTFESGPLSNPADVHGPVFDVVVGQEGAPWLRVMFGEDTRLLPGAQIRLTSLRDGAVQHLDNLTLGQWRGASAFFNGSEVRVELLAPPRSEGSRVSVSGLFAGLPGGSQEAICGNDDDRVLSQDPRAGRLLNVGCTAWLVNECVLTAGHCIGGGATTLQFNVPLSNPDGSLNHPPPSDQYSVDASSVQFTNNGVDDDWAYLGVFPNTETGLTALQAQGSRHTLASNVPPVSGQLIRVTGYGLDQTPNEHSQVQQTHAGPLRAAAGSAIEYETDTTSGNSGSAAEDESSGRAIGIHTAGGCDSSPPPYNLGTAINNAGLQAALRNPLGVCAGQPACDGDGICEAGEDCFNCGSDCAYGAPEPPSGGSCGNNICQPESGEDCRTCRADCNGKTKGNPANQYCCGDDVLCEDPRCTGNGNTCPIFSSAEATTQGYCCGDGLCENSENGTNCAVDCAAGCTTDADCSQGEICCGAVCAPPACESDADCDDGDGCSTDSCADGGTCAATCSYTFPACGAADACCGPACTSATDPDCCTPTSSKEKGPRCSDGVDNDCDGLVDGADPDC